MSDGNAEQPNAQTPKGASSPNRVEVSGEARQGAPAPNAQGQESSNGQSKEPREDQLATTRAGAGTARAGAAGGGTSPQSPATAVRPQPTSGAHSSASPSTQPLHQKQQPAQQSPQKQAPPPPTRQRQAPPPPPPTQQKQAPPPPTQQKQSPSPTTQPQQVQSPPAQPPTATTDRRPRRERRRSDAVASSIAGNPRASQCNGECRTRMGSAAASSA